MQRLARADRLLAARDVAVASALLAALAGCAPRAAAPAQRSFYAPAVVQTDFLMIGNDRGLSCNFIVTELAAGAGYTREMHTLTVTIGAGRRLGPGQVGAIVALTRADATSVNDPLRLVWPVTIDTVRFGGVRYAAPDRWPGQHGVGEASKGVWTLPRGPEVVRSVIESLNVGQVSISYMTTGSSFYAGLGPTFLGGGEQASSLRLDRSSDVECNEPSASR